MIKYFIFIALFSLQSLIFAKIDSLPQGRTEIFFNVSNALVRFTGNSNNNILIDNPFLIGAKFRNKKNNAAWRIGSNFDYTFTDELIDPSSNRTNTQNFLSINFGREWRKKIAKNFEVYAGFDLTYYQINTKTSIFATDILGQTTINDFVNNTNGPGISPLCGLIWNITPRFSLFTEANFYNRVLNTYRYTANNGTNKVVLEDKIVYKFNPIPPASIFFLYKF